MIYPYFFVGLLPAEKHQTFIPCRILKFPTSDLLLMRPFVKEERNNMRERTKFFTAFVLVMILSYTNVFAKTAAHSVIITLDGVPRMVATQAETVGELLSDCSFTAEDNYILENCSETDSLTDKMTIALTSVVEKTLAYTTVTPFTTTYRTTTELEPGEKRVVQEGKDGETVNVYRQTYHGDELVDSELIETKVVTEAQPEIIEVGEEKVINGMAYTDSIQVRATAYTPYDAGCNGITATGAKATKGIVAVDPSVIPLGTKVYIPGYGVAVAADTGGAIKGNRLDVCYDSLSDALQWGVKNVEVYILE